MLVELPLGEATAATFSLEKAVCSHGLFMMTPNVWDPQTKTLHRPLRLSHHSDDPDHRNSVSVAISQPSEFPHSLHLQVSGTDSLTSQQKDSLLIQVTRMLRLSDKDTKAVRDFQEIHGIAKERGFGRVFRSPTLFEDMIKCLLLCNCQWSRTLSMARALCELQWELQHSMSNASSSITTNGSNSGSQTSDIKYIVPNTPVIKERKRKLKKQKRVSHNDKGNILVTEVEILKCSSRIGNFPSPKELASVDVSYLAKRCNVGYRASRISKLARLVEEGGLQLKELEEASTEPSLYNKLAEQLKEIYGFGPFTCANVLVCMGFYHVIPSDSETIRHLKQVHARNTTVKTIHEDLEKIYGQYAPFQFLVYWSEVWNFYEEWFGKLNEMSAENYKLITAANMNPKSKDRSKKTSVALAAS